MGMNFGDALSIGVPFLTNLFSGKKQSEEALEILGQNPRPSTMESWGLAPGQTPRAGTAEAEMHPWNIFQQQRTEATSAYQAAVRDWEAARARGRDMEAGFGARLNDLETSRTEALGSLKRTSGLLSQEVEAAKAQREELTKLGRAIPQQVMDQAKSIMSGVMAMVSQVDKQTDALAAEFRMELADQLAAGRVAIDVATRQKKSDIAKENPNMSSWERKAANRMVDLEAAAPMMSMFNAAVDAGSKQASNFYASLAATSAAAKQTAMMTAGTVLGVAERGIEAGAEVLKAANAAVENVLQMQANFEISAAAQRSVFDQYIATFDKQGRQDLAIYFGSLAEPIGPVISDAMAAMLQTYAALRGEENALISERVAEELAARGIEYEGLRSGLNTAISMYEGYENRASAERIAREQANAQITGAGISAVGSVVGGAAGGWAGKK